MKTTDSYTEQIPTLALSCLVNGDASSLSDSEIATVDGWLRGWQELAANNLRGLLISYGDDVSEFTHRPAFGLACSTVEAEIFFTLP